MHTRFCINRMNMHGPDGKKCIEKWVKKKTSQSGDWEEERKETRCGWHRLRATGGSVTRVSVSDGLLPFVFPVHDPDGAALKLIGNTAQVIAVLV